MMNNVASPSVLWFDGDKEVCFALTCDHVRKPAQLPSSAMKNLVIKPSQFGGEGVFDTASSSGAFEAIGWELPLGAMFLRARTTASSSSFSSSSSSSSRLRDMDTPLECGASFLLSEFFLQAHESLKQAMKCLAHHGFVYIPTSNKKYIQKMESDIKRSLRQWCTSRYPHVSFRFGTGFCVDRLYKVVRILLQYGMQLLDPFKQNQFGYGLYPHLCKCNHACIPNTHFSFRMQNDLPVAQLWAAGAWQATRAQPKELLITYAFDVPFLLPFSTRQRAMANVFNGEPCRCDTCNNDVKAASVTRDVRALTQVEPGLLFGSAGQQLLQYDLGDKRNALLPLAMAQASYSEADRKLFVSAPWPLPMRTATRCEKVLRFS